MEPSGALAGGRPWRWLVGLAYGGLVVLTLIGNDTWRMAATPYLDIALIIGLWATTWQSLRRKSAAEEFADERQEFAKLKQGPVDMALAERYGLVDETGNLIEPPPPTGATTPNIVAPERAPLEPWALVRKLLLTPLFVLLLWFAGQLGLALAGWARGLF